MNRLQRYALRWPSMRGQTVPTLLVSLALPLLAHCDVDFEDEPDLDTPINLEAQPQISQANLPEAEHAPQRPSAPAAQQARPASAPAATPQATQPKTAAYFHTLQTGETIWDVAQAYGVSEDTLLAANQLSRAQASELHPGFAVRVPGARGPQTVETEADREARAALAAPQAADVPHTLQRGQTLWTLAHMYDVPVNAIMARNGLNDHTATQLQPGQVLTVPGARQPPEPTTPVTPAPAPYEHALQPGETIWDVAQRYQVSTGELMAANGLGTAEIQQLQPGQSLLIPGVASNPPGAIHRRPETARSRRAASQAQAMGLGTREVAEQLLQGRVSPNWVGVDGPARDALPGTLRWPVDEGWFARGYGAGDEGYHLALDIVGDLGSNVRAAAAGVVAYSGNDLRDYGNLILVIHRGGWVTLYAHNSVNFVHAGQQVERGEILAEVGSTGDGRDPHLHFELIVAGQSCDPGPLLRPGVRLASGQLQARAQVRWTTPGSPPAEVRCQARAAYPQAHWVADERVPRVAAIQAVRQAQRPEALSVPLDRR